MGSVTLILKDVGRAERCSSLVPVLTKEPTLRKQGYMEGYVWWVEAEGLQMLLTQLYHVGEGEPRWQGCKKDEKACCQARSFGLT